MQSALGILAVVAALLATTPVAACNRSDPHAIFAESVEKAWPRDKSPLVGTVLLHGKVWKPEPSPVHCGASPALYELSKKLSESIATPGAVLVLGEMHDNREHHWVRSLIIAGTAERMPAVVMEHMRANQSEGLAAFQSIKDGQGRPSGTLADLKRLVSWEKFGWKGYPMDVLLESIVSARLPIYAGDVSSASIMDAARKGPSARPQDERERLGLERPLSHALEAASAKEIEEAHCGKMPKEMLPGMMFAQRYRDAHLADAALAAADRHGAAILLTGNGHARKDRGVSWYISVRSPDRPVTTVLLAEIEEGETGADRYLARDPDGQPAADMVVLTPAADRPDPCEGIEFAR